MAGIGNIFLSDDGFGVEVARRLSCEEMPEGARVADFGIRGIHLAYELLDTDYDVTILVDATRRGGAPGTLYVIQPDPPGSDESTVTPDAHGMTPDTVLTLLRSLGGRADGIVVVGCEPASLDEGIGLSEPVAHAVDGAMALVVELLQKEAGR